MRSLFPNRPIASAAAVVVAATVLGAALRAFHLDFKSLWFDEAMLYVIANGDLPAVMASNAARNSAPPLFAVLLSQVMALGTSEVWLRAMSWCAGVAAIPAMYALTTRVAGRWVGCLASFLVAIAPQQIRYSQHVREYSLAFLVAVLLILAFLRFMERPSPVRAATLALLFGVAVFTQYGLAILVLSLNIVFLFVFRKAERPKAAVLWWCVVNGAGLVAVWGVYELALKQQFSAAGFGASHADDYLTLAYWDGTLASWFRLAIRQTWRIFDFAIPGTLALFVSLVGAGQAWNDGRRREVFLFGVPFAVTFAAALFRWYPYIGERQTMFLTPLIYVMCAVGIKTLADSKGSRFVAILAGLLIAGQSLNYTAGYLASTEPEHARPVIAELQRQVAPEDTVFVVHGAAPAFKYYTRHRSMSWAEGPYVAFDAGTTAAEVTALLERVDTVLAAGARTWIVFSHNTEAEAQTILGHVAQPGRRARIVYAQPGASLYLVDKRGHP